MMEENKKRAGYFNTQEEQELAGKRPKTPAKCSEINEEEDDDMLGWLSMDDETVSELSKILETEIPSAYPFKVKFSGDPYSPPEIFQSSAAYITINGYNDESCGSSFSEVDSSVMASIDMGGCGFVFQPVVDSGAGVEARGWEDAGEEEARGCVKENGEGCLVMGSDGGCGRCEEYDYDVMLARFLGEDFMESQ